MAERLKEQINPQHLPMPHRRASASNAARTAAQPPASRHYAGHHAGNHPEDTPYTTQGSLRPQRQPQQYDEDDEDDDAVYAPPPTRSAIRYTRPQQEVYTQGNREIVVHRTPPPRRRYHWMLYIGIGLFVMVLGWVLFSMLANWWQTRQDDWKYGNPRTFQTDQYVGHGDSPDHPDHFIALNIGGMVQVIEINPQIPKDDHVYPITTINDSSTPVSISFDDTNHDGKIDMLVTIGDRNPYVVILLNNGTLFTK